MVVSPALEAGYVCYFQILRKKLKYLIETEIWDYFQKQAEEGLLGQVVITTYNEKTYRIDDIDWKMNPQERFPFRGAETSYIDYYKTVSKH